MLRAIVTSVACLLLSNCGGGDTAPYPDYANPKAAVSVSLAPENVGDGWVTSTPGAEGMDAPHLSSLFDSLRNGVFPGVDSMVVARNQRLVAEGYFNGFDRDTVHDLRSTGKSFMSTLVAIALEQGLLDLDDPLSQHIAGFEDHRHMNDAKRAITLRHLLNMNSGLECSDWDTGSPGHEEKLYDSRDWIGFVLNLPMEAQPGARGSYCTGGVVVLGHVVSQRSGMALDAFAQQWLLGPLGIQQSYWRRSPDGQTTGATGFGLRPRDAAKLGALFANEGLWNGQRVVSDSWVMRTRERVQVLGQGWYGYLWWKRTFPHRGADLEAVYAAGNGGNYIFIIPSHELVVAFTGSNYNTDRSDTPHRIMPLVLSALP